MISLWYFRLVTQTSLEAVMTQALMPSLGTIVFAGAVVVLTTAVTAMKAREATSTRNNFSSWGLGRSKAKIPPQKNAATVRLQVVITSILILTSSVSSDGFQQDMTPYHILAGGQILIWLLARESVHAAESRRLKSLEHTRRGVCGEDLPAPPDIRSRNSRHSRERYLSDSASETSGRTTEERIALLVLREFFVVADHFGDDELEELLGEHGIEARFFRKGS